MAYLAWKVLGTLSRFRWCDGYTSQNVFISIFFALSSGTSANPYFPLRRAFLLLYAFSILKFEPPYSLIKKHQLGGNMIVLKYWVMNGSMFELIFECVS